MLAVQPCSVVVSVLICSSSLGGLLNGHASVAGGGGRGGTGECSGDRDQSLAYIRIPWLPLAQGFWLKVRMPEEPLVHLGVLLSSNCVDSFIYSFERQRKRAGVPLCWFAAQMFARPGLIHASPGLSSELRPSQGQELDYSSHHRPPTVCLSRKPEPALGWSAITAGLNTLLFRDCKAVTLIHALKNCLSKGSILVP